MQQLFNYIFGEAKPPYVSPHSGKYGWIPDIYTESDMVERPELSLYKKFTYHPLLNSVTGVDLRSNCPSVYDQGNLGSCTANAICGAYAFEMIKQGEQNVDMSRLFLYYNERVIEGSVATDSGAQIKDGVYSIGSTGVCPESEWEYVTSRFTDKPTDQCYTDASRHIATVYERVRQDLDDVKQSLLDGFPVIFGFQVYESFESESTAETGVMVMPKTGEKLLGGHAVLAVGFDDVKKTIIVRNSWGNKWGDNGYFYMPYQYLTTPNYTSDYWSLRVVKDQ